MDKDATITFRLPAPMKEAAERAAEADCRSLGQLCTFLLMKHLEARGEWPARNAGSRSGSGKRTRADRR